MKKIVLLLVAVANLQAAQTYSNKSQQAQRDPRIVVEPDQTDIFAIPLDEDAEDQQEELDMFEKYGEHPNASNSRSKW